MTFTLGDLIFDKYRIERELGRGAFGMVYLARHTTLGTLVAIKMLHSEMTGVSSTMLNDYKKRFYLESKAKIDHPNVVKVNNFEADAAGALLLEMEYVPGGTLADLLKQGPAPIEQVLAVLRDGLAGLTAMHEHARGTFVHRDLKPSNILLDATGRAKIADLGSAQTPWDNPSLLGTLAPPHPGTAGYRSPEHEVGNSLLTPSADVYGLGCVAFELLTGKRWFDAQRDADGPRDLRGDVPDWLDAIVRRMLNETPGKKKADRDDATKRYVDCRDVAQAMKQGADEAKRKVEAEEAERERQEREAEAKRKVEAEQAERIRKEQEAIECYSRGVIYHNKGDYDCAIAEYGKAIELNPNNPDYWFQRGKSYSRNNNETQAIADYNSAIQINPNKHDYYYERSSSYFKRQDILRYLTDKIKADHMVRMSSAGRHLI
ncbi:MAG: protein kinase [Anaerolineae bacterium]|nr:protein kinase [Anaerolineae bacterium]